MGTDADNVRDKVSKARQAKGSVNGRSKLTELEVIEIIKLHSTGASKTTLASEFGVSTRAIYSIVKGLNWKHLKTP